MSFIIQLTLILLLSSAAQAKDGYEESLMGARQAILKYRQGDIQGSWNQFKQVRMERLRSREYLHGLKGKIATDLAQSDPSIDLWKVAYQEYQQAYRHSHNLAYRKTLAPELAASLEHLIAAEFRDRRAFSALKHLEEFYFYAGDLWRDHWEKRYIEGLRKTGQTSRIKSMQLKAGLKISKGREAKFLQNRSLVTWASSKDKLVDHFSDIVKELKKTPHMLNKRKTANNISDAYTWAMSHQQTPKAKIFLKKYKKLRLKLPPGILVHLIDPIWDAGHFEEARTIAQYVLRHYPASDAFERISFQIGRIYQDLRAYKRSSVYFKKYLDHYPQGMYSERALFQLAFSQYLRSSRKSIDHFERYLELYSTGRHASGARFFLIKALERHGKNHALKSISEDLLTRYPLNLYSFLIREANGDKSLWEKGLFTSKKPSFLSNHDAISIPFSMQLLLRKLEEMEHLGLLSESRGELANISFDASRPKLMYTLAMMCYRMQQNHIGLNFLTKLLYVDPGLRPYLNIKMLFPDLYGSEIDSALARLRSSLSRQLIQAQMRQESAFQEDALSSAGAKGLLQLMPATARRARKLLKLSPTKESLFEPRQNILLGISVLEELLKRYEGNLIYALAAYNAGPKAVSRWIKARGHLDPLSFAESIPYQETRIYVLTILRNEAIYKSLYRPSGDHNIKFKYLY